jgi:hypothetical protein
MPAACRIPDEPKKAEEARESREKTRMPATYERCSIHPGGEGLFMSGYTASVISQHGVLAPGVCFIQKPFSLRDLAATVRKALDQAQA